MQNYLSILILDPARTTLKEHQDGREFGIRVIRTFRFDEMLKTRARTDLCTCCIFNSNCS